MMPVNKIAIIIAFGIIANIGLFMNAGYFSHDEIGWGIRAISANNLMEIKYFHLLDYNKFHYRPLNFNIWLASSYYLYEVPQLFHFFLLLCGLVNAILFYFIIKYFVYENVAFLSAMISTVMPSIVFVNGWIGTIADIFWFMCCSLSFFLFLASNASRNNSKYLFFISASIFFIVSLMFKETAVIYPAVIFLSLAYNFLLNSDKRYILDRWGVNFFLVCSLVVITYLVLRFEYLFPKQGGYGTSLSNIPGRALEYFIFPFLLDNIEIHGLFEQYDRTQLIISAALHVFFIVLLCRGSFLKYLFYIALYYVGAIPVLILDMSLPHYIYTSGFVLAFGIAVLYYRNGIDRLLSVVFFSLLFTHSVYLQKNYVDSGSYQNNFVNTLYSVISSTKNEHCQYLIEPAFGSKVWIAIRAISFRKTIDDLTLPKDIIFNKNVLNTMDHKRVCNLFLDVDGRVKLTGVSDEK
ncbi:glycosyltransferase family 39 protein [[Enterobacter] lignolyticus]|uniref:Glycosyltransferase RgtA/B/C/D-like domain-containing protein n=1 Tax=[Enterobacter] lignolyticus TaxID=1334193 RepID=A0A806X5V2_9ENTR|nr:glycosyltransferase family 39 protein [[Enterobacter] lignolyticus]ALR77300.1 hypothetical protein AO703_13665 [[Enterobacter] lignolyticus]